MTRKERKQREPREPRLGVDFGRVVMGAADPSGRADTSFLSGGEEQAMATPAVPRAFEVLSRLVDDFEGRAWIVSKCGPRVAGRTRRWMRVNDFHRRTGIPPEHVRTCLRREDKRLHCRQLRITHFIDDRLDVLRHLRGQVANLYLFGHQTTPAPDWVRHVVDWSEVETALLTQRVSGAA
ncbi:MAG: hypothetical protein AAF533_07490 [Acidobacteriota bacterium]